MANTDATAGPLIVTVHVTNAGAFSFPLHSTETRFATLSMDIPQSACSGTYTVTVTVKNTITGVTFTKKTTFTVMIGAP